MVPSEAWGQQHGRLQKIGGIAFCILKSLKRTCARCGYQGPGPRFTTLEPIPQAGTQYSMGELLRMVEDEELKCRIDMN